MCGRACVRVGEVSGCCGGWHFKSKGRMRMQFIDRVFASGGVPGGRGRDGRERQLQEEREREGVRNLVKGK